ncbi:prephenate dehydratase [Candidatus Dojkabacteria bacterium]|uniref:Prephenate dehydratase n=1 Tax=Candidatus Dojkabacteria bacterium TaxID=2099670 RepID=A0A955L9H4_9BACT|nr:prephenate dehydratase [Candidatus Dojkabacteria bacterium]
MSKKVISIQGTKGSYSHIAAQHMFGEDITLRERETFKALFDDVREQNADYAVLPIENSTHGSIFENYDHLTNYDLHIIGELYLKINFHLIGLPGTKIEELTDVFTHRVSLSQIKDFLHEHPNLEPHAYHDNGAAVEMIAKKADKTHAAAASKLAAELFGMEVLEEKIQDNPKNYTRFFVLSREEEYKKDTNKSTVQFEVKHTPGTLVKALESFSNLGISLSKIESRPILNTTWEYRFYVDLEAGLSDEKMKSALTEMLKHTRNVRVLGTYTFGEYIDT